MDAIKRFKETQNIWLRASVGLPKDHPQYEEQQLLQNMVVGAALGGGFIGFIIGLFFGWLM